MSTNPRETDVLVLNFRGIPDGVTVTASLDGNRNGNGGGYGTDLAPLMLQTGEDEGADEDGVVDLSSTGAGEIVYKFDTDYLLTTTKIRLCPDAATEQAMVRGTAPIPQVDDDTKEWNNVEITFSWEAGEPPLDMGTVTVSYHPVVSTVSNDG